MSAPVHDPKLPARSLTFQDMRLFYHVCRTPMQMGSTAEIPGPVTNSLLGTSVGNS